MSDTVAAEQVPSLTFAALVETIRRQLSDPPPSSIGELIDRSEDAYLVINLGATL
jgi:hypothetical protein